MMADMSENQQQQHLANMAQQQSQNQAMTQATSSLETQHNPQLQQQQSQHNPDLNGTLALTLRLLMQGKEVGSIIGRKGDNIKRFREVSGAKINVSDSSCPDRIVTLSGTLDEVYNAFSMICSKFEEQILQVNTSSGIGATSGSNSASSSGGGGGGGSSANNSMILSNSQVAIGGSSPQSQSNSVIDPLFGLPNSGLLNTTIKQERSLSGKEADLLTINNNCTTTINNNNINAPNKNLIANNLKNGGSSPAAVATNQQVASQHQPSVTVRLIVPASQCGSLIGRGGAKIKELRELTSATIQVAPDVLPNSTERVVTVSGSVNSLKNCTYHICKIMVESPPKGYVIPYRPKPTLNPMLLAAVSTGQAAAAYNLPGQFALSAHPDVNRLFVANNPLAAAFNPGAAANLRAAAASGQAASALSAAASSQSMSSQEMAIPNGLIGCVIGKGGSKINEIRQLSGANIKISNTEEGTKNRTVTINGTPEAINLAQYLITARQQRDVGKIEVVTEAARYIDHLHKTLIERFVLCGIPDSLKDVLGTDDASQLGSHHIMNLVANMAAAQKQQEQCQQLARQQQQLRRNPHLYNQHLHRQHHNQTGAVAPTSARPREQSACGMRTSLGRKPHSAHTTSPLVAVRRPGHGRVGISSSPASYRRARTGLPLPAATPLSRRGSESDDDDHLKDLKR